MLSDLSPPCITCTGTVKVMQGGLEIMNEAGTDRTVIAQAAAIVRLDI